MSTDLFFAYYSKCDYGRSAMGIVNSCSPATEWQWSRQGGSLTVSEESINAFPHDRASTVSLLAELELDSDSDLSFSSGQDLTCLSESFSWTVGTIKYCGRVLTVQQIEKLKQELHVDSLADVEPLGEA